MVKVLHKAFSIIEAVSSAPPGPKSVSELAQKAGLPLPTTARILKDLSEAGYLDKVSRTQGYILGPMMFQLCRGQRYMSELLDIAEPLVDRCAEATGQSVLLSVLKHRRRYILCHQNRNPALNIHIDRPYYKNFYRTATGRIQLAYLSEDDLLDLVDSEGMPGHDWEQVADIDSLQSALAQVRQDGFCRHDNTAFSLSTMGMPVFKDGCYLAALGASMPSFANQDDQERVFAKLNETAKLISLGLSTLSAFA